MDFCKRQQLISEWEARGMEDDGCCCGRCGAEAGSHRRSGAAERRRRETRLRRVAQVTAAALVALTAAALLLLFAVVFGVPGPRQADSQVTSTQQLQESGRLLSGVSGRQQKPEDAEKPSAMLTVSDDGNVGPRLRWLTEKGNAFCRGGFNYSDGYLVVPRTGLYRVFLQITYVMNDSSCGGEEQILANTVYVISDSYPKDVILLSSVDTVSCSMKLLKKSLYASGLFSLETNSKLHTASRHPTLIVQDEHQVFFGAELLSP